IDLRNTVVLDQERVVSLAGNARRRPVRAPGEYGLRRTGRREMHDKLIVADVDVVVEHPRLDIDAGTQERLAGHAVALIPANAGHLALARVRQDYSAARGVGEDQFLEFLVLEFIKAKEKAAEP